MAKTCTTTQMAVLDALSAHIALLDGDGVITSVNKAWRQFADANVLQAPGPGIGLNYLHVCDGARGEEASQAREVAAGIRSVLVGATKNFSIEYPCHSAAEERWFQLTVTPLADAHPSRAVVMHVNITERKRAEKALKALSSQTERRERMLSTMLSSISDFTYVFDRDGRFLFANKPLLDLWGATLEAVLGRNFQDLGYPPELAERLQRQVQQVFATGKRVKDETLYVDPSGLPGYYEYIFSPAFATDGSVDFVVGNSRDVTERKHAEETTQRSQRHLRHLIDGLSPSMFVGLLTPQGILVEASQAPLVAAGLEPQDVLGKPFEETHWWSHSPQVRQQLREAIVRAAQGEPSQYEVRVRGAKDDFIDIDFSLRPLHDERGEIIFLIPSANVITERKRAEMALREREAEFRTLAESVPQIVWTAKPDGRIVYFNPQWMDYTGLGCEESLGHGWTRALHPEDRRRALEAWQEAATTPGIYSVEGRLRRADGAYRWWLARGVPLLDAGGNVLKWFGTCTDIHDLKQAELEISHAHQALSESEQRHRSLFEDNPDPVYSLDRDGRITDANAAYAQMTGYGRAETLAMGFLRMVAPEQVASTLAHFGRALGGEPVRFESVRLHKDGRRIAVDVNYQPIMVQGAITGVYAVLKDITDRKRAEEALRELNTQLEARVQARTAELNLAREEADQANNAKSSFLAAMSHEIRTPMNGVVGMLEVLHQTSLTDQQVEMVDLIRDSALSLLTIVDDILDFSKMEAGKMALVNEPMRLGEVIEKSCGMLIQMAVKRGVHVNLFIDPEIPCTVRGDEGRLRQVLVNLVGNAIKFSSGREQPGRVSVRVLLVERQAEHVVVDMVVADNGIGMDDVAQARLFTPFLQADASTTRRFGGTGLGLAITDMLVHLMSGQISVLSAPGQGSTFTVRLRFATLQALAMGRVPQDGGDGQGDPAGPPAPASQSRQAPLQRPLILVAEDNETNRTVILHQLQLMGFAAEVCANGREALERWRGGGFALLLTDLHMPEMDGYELVAAIRSEEYAQHRLPIIALTANALRDEELRCLAAGMDAYLTKPVRLPQLKAAIEAWLHPATPVDASQAGDPASVEISPPVDLRVLEELVGDDPVLIDEVLNAFRESAAQCSAEISEAIGQGSMQAVAAAAHKLKSAARSIGSNRLGQLCADIENAAEARRSDQVDTLLLAFGTELQAVLGFLTAR